jgi:hypothetical protein
MELVGQASDPVPLLLAVDETCADVLIVSLLENEKEPGVCSHLLMEYPGLIVLALSSTVSHGLLLRRPFSREAVADTSDESILLTIRNASGSDDAGT